MEIQELILLEQCEKYRGRYINNLNRSQAPFATTYSKEFCDSCADLVILYKNNKIRDPILRLSEKLTERNIRTCRDNQMNIQNVKYLYKRYLNIKVKENKYSELNNLRLQTGLGKQ